MSESNQPVVTEESVRAALRPVEDPELHWSIVDLGLIYGVKIEPAPEGDGSLVTVDMTLTSPGCPYGPMLIAQTHNAVKTMPEVKQVKVNVVWNPPWDPRTMATDEVKMELGFM